MKAMKMKNKILELSKRKGNIYKLTIGKRIFYGIDEVLLTSSNLSFKLEDKQFIQGDASQLEEDVKSYYRPIKLLYTKVFIKNKETEVLLLKTEENDIICIDRQYLDYFDQSALFKIGGIDRPIEVLENGLFVGLVNHKIKDRDEIVKDLINKFAEYKAEYYRMEDKAKLNAETEMDSIKREKRERACRKRQKKMIKKMDKIFDFLGTDVNCLERIVE